MKKYTLNPVMDLETLLWVASDGVFEYDGPVMECKKGRERVEKNMEADAQTAGQNRANSQQAYGKAQGLLGEDIGSTTPGSLSPAASAQLASDLGNVNRVYNGMRATAFSALGQRGFGNAPSGFSTAAQNGLNVGQEGAETGAFRNAQVNTQNQRNFATQQEAGLAGQQGGLGNTASGESTSAAVARNQMGSTAGDIAGGIAAMAPIVAAPFTGGASLAMMSGMPMGTKLWGNMGGPSGVGGYGTPGISGGAPNPLTKSLST